MANNPKTIVLKGHPEAMWEYPANAAITPGHLIYLLSTGKVAVNAAAGAQCRKLFALENALLGKGIDDAYAANDLVQAGEMERGSVVYAWIPAAAAAIVVGDKLTSNGDGAVKKASAASQSGTTPFAYTAADEVIGYAAEAVDNSGGGTAVRLRMIVD